MTGASGQIELAILAWDSGGRSFGRQAVYHRCHFASLPNHFGPLPRSCPLVSACACLAVDCLSSVSPAAS